MIEDGSLWETLRRHVAPEYVVACVQVILIITRRRYNAVPSVDVPGVSSRL